MKLRKRVVDLQASDRLLLLTGVLAYISSGIVLIYASVAIKNFYALILLSLLFLSTLFALIYVVFRIEGVRAKTETVEVRPITRTRVSGKEVLKIMHDFEFFWILFLSYLIPSSVYMAVTGNYFLMLTLIGSFAGLTAGVCSRLTGETVICDRGIATLGMITEWSRIKGFKKTEKYLIVYGGLKAPIAVIPKSAVSEEILDRFIRMSRDMNRANKAQVPHVEMSKQ